MKIKDWKSGMLCSAAFWALDPRINPTYTTRDPTRKPCVLYVTGENDMMETIERMLSNKLGSDVELRGSDPDEMVRRMEEAFSSEHCEFVFKYRASGSITTADLEVMMQELHTAGREVIMVVQDYIKRIKPVQESSDQRHLELGYVVDEFSSIAKAYNIPVVTGMQLNRDAYVKVEAAVKAGRLDAVKELGASQVGESINVFENADFVIFQNRVTLESTGAIWLTVRRGKCRGRPTTRDYFAHPFDRNAGDQNVNTMRLVEDAYLPVRQCASVMDLGDGVVRDYDANASTNLTVPRSAAEIAGSARAAPPPANPPPSSGGRPSARTSANAKLLGMRPPGVVAPPPPPPPPETAEPWGEPDLDQM